MRVTNSDHILLSLSVRAASNTVFRLDVQFREVRVLQSVEAQKSMLKLVVINAVDIILTITDSY